MNNNNATAITNNNPTTTKIVSVSKKKDLSVKTRALTKVEVPEIIEHLNMKETSENPKCDLDLDIPLFQPFPNSVIFSEYEEYHSYSQPLVFRNVDRVTRHLGIGKFDSEYFTIRKEVDEMKVDGKIAPGMEVKYIVTFTPHERKEYRAELIVTTERERFVVVIAAPGPAPILICPDMIDFGKTPSRLPVTKNIVVYNKGDDCAILQPYINLPYSIQIDNPTIPPNGLTTMDITITPSSNLLSLHSSLVLVYGNNLSKVIDLHATIEDLDIGLSSDIVAMDPTYISLESRKIFKIINNSNSQCKFIWKTYRTEQEDDQEKQRLHNELNQLENQENQLLQDASLRQSRVPDTSSSSAVIARKYKTLNTQVDRDSLEFEDKNITINPVSGTIWSHSEIQLTAIFHPTIAADFEICTYCEIEGRLERLPLLITGSSIGPKAVFSYDVLDIGDIFIHSTHRYDVSLQNLGAISCEYKLIDKCRRPNVVFTPPEGILQIEEKILLEVSYTGTTLGEFADHFEFALKGSQQNITLTIKGHVVGPTFFFNKNKLDFGIVSYAFLNSTDITLRNTSSVPFKFELRVPQDGNFLNKEFEIIPSIATILPEGEERISINFISQTIKVYEYCLAIDIENVGEALLTVPIRAECRVAEVSLIEESLQYGDCYLRYPYYRTLTLTNKSNLSARFDVTDQESRSQSIGLYQVDPPRGVLGPECVMVLKVQFNCEKLGDARLPLYVQIIGSPRPPLVLSIEANGLGPVIKSNVSKISFGEITCLDTHQKEFILTNKSPIPAPYKLDFKKGFRFNVDIYQGVLQKEESVTIVSSAMLEDTLEYRDTLFITVTEGDSINLPVYAKGIGTTLFCEDQIDVIDFGDKFTNRTIERVFLLENRGLRAQRITWINQTAIEKEKALKLSKAKMEGEATSIAARRKQNDLSDYKPIFTITPNTIELKPSTAVNFIISGLCAKPIQVTELFQCLTKYEGEIRNAEALKTEVRVNFITPLIQCSEDKISFKYTYTPGEECVVQSKTIVFKNISPLSLDCLISTIAPFILSTFEFHLEPNESTNVTIQFDPNYKNNRQSHSITTTLKIHYVGHPQQDSIPCTGEIVFPNLWISQNEFDFGCILNNTQRTLLFTLENRGPIIAPYHWLLEVDEADNQIPVNEIFEIQPIQGILEPGQSEEVEIKYSGIPHVLSRALGKCFVDGGPTYTIKMKGESSVVSYRLDKQNLDFGRIPYLKIEERDFHIYNTGAVDFTFKILTNEVSRPGLVGVSPCTGLIPAHGQQRISVKMRVGIPDAVIEKISIEIAHYLPIEFPLYITGIYANIKVNDVDLVLPDNWDHYLTEADRLIELSNTEHPVSFPILPSPTKDPSQNLSNRELIPDAVDETSSEQLPPQSARSTVSQSSNTNQLNIPVLPLSDNTGKLPTNLNTQVIQITIDRESEALRLYYIDLLLKEMSEKNPDQLSLLPKSKRENKTTLESNTITSTTQNRSPTSKSTKEAARTISALHLGEFSLATFVVDFKNVVRASSKETTFSITNIGNLPVNFELERRTLKNSGYTITPDKVQRLPESSSISFTVGFYAKEDLPYGIYELPIPFRVQGGPTYTILLRADVCIPRLFFNPPCLDFGELLLGRTQIAYVTLINECPVAVEWRWRIDQAQGVGGNQIKLYENAGKLDSQTKRNIKIQFTPTQIGELNVFIPMRFKLNPSAAKLQIVGMAYDENIEIIPPQISFPPVQPHLDPIIESFTIRNISKDPIEIFSLEYDKQYLEEEHILSQITDYDEHDLMKTDIREPGTKLNVELPATAIEEPPPVVEVKPDLPKTASRKSIGKEKKAKEEYIPVIPSENPMEMNPDEVIFPEFLKKPEQFLETVPELLADRQNARNLLLIGPSHSGKHTVANKLSEYFEIPQINLSDIFKTLISKKTPIGWVLIAKILRREEILIWEGEPIPKGGKKKMPPPKKPKKGETIEIPPVYFGTAAVKAAIKEFFLLPENSNGAIIIADAYEYIETPLEGIKCLIDILGQPEYGGINIMHVNAPPDLLVQRIVNQWKLDNPPPEIVTEEDKPNENEAEQNIDISLKPETEPVPAIPEPIPEPTPEPPKVIEEKVAPKGKKEKKGGHSPVKAPEPVQPPVEEVKIEESLPPHYPTDEELVTKFTTEIMNDYNFGPFKELLFASLDECKLNAASRIPKPVVEGLEDPLVEVAPEPVPEPEPVVIEVEDPKKLKRSKSQEKKVSEKKKGKKEEEIVVIPVVPYGTGLLVDIYKNNGEGTIDDTLNEIKGYFPGFSTYGDWKVPKRESYQLVPKPHPRPPISLSEHFLLVDDNSLSRWVLQPTEEVQLKVTFASQTIGKFQSSFHFEILGKPRTYEVPVNGVCEFPIMNTDVRNIFMKRTKLKNEQQIISKQYITNKNYYEFGPLLIGKRIDMKESNPVLKQTNCETLRITNNGLFETTMDLSMQVDDKIFVIEPTSLTIPIGETHTIDLWAFPVEAKQYTNTLVFCLKDNPIPTLIPLQCTGFLPQIELQGLMNDEQYAEWLAKIEEENNAAGQKATKRSGSPNKDKKAQAKRAKTPEKKKSIVKKGEAPKNDPQINLEEIGTYHIDFERILITHTDVKTFFLVNNGKIPIQYTINAPDFEGIEEIVINPKLGVLNPGSKSPIQVTYNAIKEYILDSKTFEILVSDNEPIKFPKQQQYQKKITVEVKGETYVVKAVLVKDPADSSPVYHLDFGVIQVCDHPSKSIVLENQGKFDIKYNFSCRGQTVKSLFKLTPPFGTINPSSKQEISFKFSASSAITLTSNKDVRCRIVDQRNNELISEFPLAITVRTVFSTLSCLPPGGISFGSMHYDEKKVKNLQIRNDGEFPFNCKITDINQPIDMTPEPQVVAVPTKGGKPARKSIPNSKKEKVVAPAALTVGDFGINPADFSIQPGSSATVSITYSAVGNKSTQERLLFNVSNIDPKIASDLSYIITGESVYPAIETENFDSIFEEQTVLNDLSTLDPSSNTPIYSISESLFYIGAVIPTSQPNGISQRVRITNIQRILCTVNFQITPKTGVDPAIFTLQPASLDIPPHEYRYVTIYFKPQLMGKYEASFLGKVVDCNDPKKGELKFDVRGSSVLPSLQIVRPTTRSETGKLKIDFGKIRAGKVKTETIEIQNCGILSAKCHINMDVSGVFSLKPSAGEVLTLNPNDSKEYTLSFNPRGKQDYKADMSLYVQNNPYERSEFIVTGCGLQEDLAFNGLPNDLDNELQFYPYYIDPNKTEGETVSFQIENTTNNVIKFTFPNDTPFRFNPSVGHMSPHTTKDVTVTFHTSEPLVLDREELLVSVQTIKINPPTKEDDEIINDWDNSMKTVKFVSKSQYLQLQNAANGSEKDLKNRKKTPVKKPPPKPKTPITGKKGQKEVKKTSSMPYFEPPPLYPPLAADAIEPIEIAEILPEPAFTPVEGEPREITLYCSLRADSVRYSAAPQDVNFAETMMFEKRCYEFDVKNESETPLDINWSMLNENGDVADEITPTPFSFQPNTVSIPPSKSQHFKLLFEPLDANNYNYTANANIPMLPKEQEPLLIHITGKSLRPLCHFDILPSDYLSTRAEGLYNQDGELNGSLDPNVSVLTIDSLGTHVKNVLKFGVTNPTNIPLDYEFVPCGVSNQAFQCITNRGVIIPGKRQNLVFEFTPTATGIQEAFYHFNIPSKKISTLFLIVGIVKEPKIFLDPPSVNFNAVLLHRTNSKIIQIVNHDHIPFAFTFDRSCVGPGTPVTIDPISGSVPPNGALPIEVTFQPQDEIFFSTNVPLTIHKKTSKLMLNIKGEGYELHDKFLVQDGGSAIPSLQIEANEPHVIDFGNIFLNEICTKTIYIENNGNFPADYRWSESRDPNITITPSTATVNANETGTCTISFHPTGRHLVEINNLRLTCVLGELKRYIINLNGRAAIPKVNFSFTSYNFGPVALVNAGISPRPATALLLVTNNEPEREVTLNCSYQKTDSFEVPFQPTTLTPGQFVEIPILFTPRDEISYSDSMAFEINGCSNQLLQLKGSGTKLHLEFVDLRHQVVQFNRSQVGSSNSRTIQVTNRSLCAFAFEIVPDQKGVLPETNYLKYYPHDAVSIKPKQIVDITIEFNPIKRLLAFENYFCVRINGGEPLSFFVVRASCQGVDVVLETSLLQFGAVCLGSSVTRKILLSNEGDKRTHYRWNAAQFAPSYSIFPLEGALLPNTPVSLNITFKPQGLSADVRADGIICTIEDSEPLVLTLSGSCIEQPAQGDKELRFECEVRKQTSQVIKITNPTIDAWFIHPVIQNESWTGLPSVTVPSKGSVDYVVTFSPETYNGDRSKLDLTVSSKPPTPEPGKKAPPKPKKAAAASALFNWNNPHKGNVFMSLPDGSTINYALLGACSLPTSLEFPPNIKLETPCKKPYLISLPVYNWMKTVQKYTVVIDHPPNNSTFIKIPNSINIPALSSRECQLSFLSYKPGPTEINVKFVCDSTGEYSYYQFTMNALAAETMNTYSLTTHVRASAKQIITINNPLPLTTTITQPTPFLKTPNPCIRCSVSKELTGHKEGNFLLEYRPLLAGESECDIQIVTNELGEFAYKLKLKAIESGYDRSYNLSVGFGSKVVEECKFTSFCPTATDYKCTIEGSKDFIVDPLVKAVAATTWEGVPLIAKITYEPSQLGETKATLKIESPVGGIYKYQLFGKCLPPQPLGPLTVAKGKQISVPFKNSFVTTRTFQIYFENPLFTGGANQQSIQEKKEVQLPIKYAGSKDGKEVLSKMIVSCQEDSTVGPWIYYLRGVESETGSVQRRKSKAK